MGPSINMIGLKHAPGCPPNWARKDGHLLHGEPGCLFELLLPWLRKRYP